MSHRVRLSYRIARLLVPSALSAALVLSGATDPAVASTGRVVAIGDIHGEYEGLISILRETGLIDEHRQWVGGDATLVQTGDFVDRGSEVRGVMDLLMSLQRQAPSQGGRVVVLLGNHEMMNLLGDFQDAGEEIFSSFASADAEKLREAAWKSWVRWIRQLARSRGGSPPQFDREKKQLWMDEHPLGYFEFSQAMRAEGEYGRWLRELPVIEKIGDIVYMHAGISPLFAEMGIDEINARHRQEISEFAENRRELVKRGVIPEHFNLYEINQALIYQANNPPLKSYFDAVQHDLIVKASEDINRLQELLLQDSPLWYRGFSMLPEEELQAHLDRLQSRYGAHRFVVAHSPMDAGNIRSRLGGRVFLIDTGMLTSYYKGRASALEVADGRISAIYVNERYVLVEATGDPLPASTAAADSASRQRASAVPAVYRLGGANHTQLAAYPPEETSPAERPRRVWKGPDGKPLPFQSVEEVEGFLRTARVVSQEDIPKGITKPKKILLEGNGVRAHAKFNYVDRQGQREKLADGTIEMYFLDSFKADMAAYELSRLLGMGNVPPGVLRSIDGQEGIVQLWVEGLTTYEQWLEEGNSGTPPSLFLERQVMDMRVFDLLIRNTDRNQGNIVWDEDKNLWLIDHTRSMARDSGLRDADKVKSCSRGLYQALRQLDQGTVEERLQPYLGTYEIKALLKRHEKLLKLMEQLIKKQGEDEVLFNYGDPPKGMVIQYDDAAA